MLLADLKMENPLGSPTYRISGVRYLTAQATVAERHLPCICGKLDNRSA